MLGFGDQPHHLWHAPGSQLHGAAMSGCIGCALYNFGDIISMVPNVNGAPGVVPLRKLCHEPLPMLVPLPTMSFWPDLPLILASFSVPPSCIHRAPTHLFHIYYMELQQSASLSVASTCPPCCLPNVEPAASRRLLVAVKGNVMARPGQQASPQS